MDGTVTLREHTEALREADQRALQIKEKADEKALDLAREAQRYRDEQMNKLREQISEERGKYLTQEVYNDRHEELIRRISALELRDGERGGKGAGLAAGWAYLLGVVTLASSLIAIAILLTH